MPSVCIILLLYDYSVKVKKFHTFKFKHKDKIEKEEFKVKKFGGTTIEILLNTVWSFNAMTMRTKFTKLMMCSYFEKCLMGNALKEYHLVTLYKNEQIEKI